MSPLTDVHQVNGCARKRMAPSISHHGARLVRLTRHLISQGVLTPPAHYEAITRALVSPWIVGDCLRDVVRKDAASDSWLMNGHDKSVVDKIAMPLVRMHLAAPGRQELAAFNPFRRVTPRLAFGTGDDDRFIGVARELDRRLRPMQQSVGRGRGSRCIVHGDYHVGQLVLETGRETPWLLDLEDVSLGWAESDIGNVVGHYVTSEQLITGDIAQAFSGFAARLVASYERHGGLPLSMPGVTYYGAVTLLRRALKAHEKSGSSLPAYSALYAAVCLQRDLVASA